MPPNVQARVSPRLWPSTITCTSTPSANARPSPQQCGASTIVGPRWLLAAGTKIADVATTASGVRPGGLGEKAARTLDCACYAPFLCCGTSLRSWTRLFLIGAPDHAQKSKREVNRAHFAIRPPQAKQARKGEGELLVPCTSPRASPCRPRMRQAIQGFHQVRLKGQHHWGPSSGGRKRQNRSPKGVDRSFVGLGFTRLGFGWKSVPTTPAAAPEPKSQGRSWPRGARPNELGKAYFGCAAAIHVFQRRRPDTPVCVSKDMARLNRNANSFDHPEGAGG